MPTSTTAAARGPSTRRAGGGALLVTLIGTALSLGLALYIAQWERQALRASLVDRAGETFKIVEATLGESMEVLHGLASLHRAVGTLTPEQFHDFAARAAARHPNLQAVEWIARVPHAAREDIEVRRRGADAPAFRITQLGPGGTLQPAAVREEYFPVYYLEPFEGNRVALGMDLAANPERREALERARDTGRPSATRPVRLAQERDGQQGFLVFLPVYEGEPGSIAQRRDSLLGFSLVVFRAGNLLESAFRDLIAAGISIDVRDLAAAAPLLQRTGDVVASGWPALWSAANLAWQTTLPVAGREWQFTFSPGPGFVAQRPPWQAIASLLTGLMLTALLAAGLRHSARRAREIDLANAALQAEVREREHAERAAHTASRAKSEFLASMGHEIRTPLNAVIGYAQLLRRDPRLDRDQRESANAIIVSGNHLLSHVNDVLDLAKIESGRSELRPEAVDLGGLLRELELMFRPRCREKRLQLRVEGPGECWVARTDPGKLRQILINLCGNAVRFTATGEVFLGCRGMPEGEVRFDVIDTGPGIAAADLERIFEPFFQTRAASGGTGLGLAIAQRLVELMGGRMEVASELGSGTRFTLLLPLQREVADSVAAPAPAVSSWKLRAAAPVRALVVDDVAANRDLPQRLLQDAGIAVVTADSCAVALEAAQAAACDVILLDVHLPDGDGLELVARLRALQPGAVLIAYTAFAFEQDRQRCLAAGCHAFLDKPLRAEALFDCLEHQAGLEFERRYLDEAEEAAPRLPDYQRLRVPEDLLTQLLTAADLHSTTVLKDSLERLQQLGEEERLLAGHLRERMRSYDMEGVARLLVPVPHSVEMA